MAKVFVVAKREAPIRELCGGARQFADEVSLVVFEDTDVPEGMADVVYTLKTEEGRIGPDGAGALAQLLNEQQPDAVFIEQTRSTQLLVARVAAKLDVSALANVCQVKALDEVVIMHYGGLANRTVKVKAKPAMYFIRPATFDDPEPRGANEARTIEPVPADGYYPMPVAERPRVKGDVDLPSAKRIVGIGRGVQKEEDLVMIREFADLIGAELACSRSIYETEGWLPKEALVGISGTTITPDLYFTIGISGQAQHMVACDGATTITCINIEPNEMIFDASDYGSKADLYEVMPRIVEYFKEHPLK